MMPIAKARTIILLGTKAKRISELMTMVSKAKRMSIKTQKTSQKAMIPIT